MQFWRRLRYVGGRARISIEFPAQPAEPVTHLSLEAGSVYGPLYRLTYDADGVYLDEVSINPAPGALLHFRFDHRDRQRDV